MEQVPENLQIVGIRHHSPACARLVVERLEALRPRFVLIEGPADFNERLPELLLEHQPPLAIFTYRQDAGVPARSSFSPFCTWSPEWQALRRGHELGAEVLFCDLPAWHEVFDGRRNLSADHHISPSPGLVRKETAESYREALCRRCGVDDADALWDHLFEQPTSSASLAQSLERHFDQLRGEEAAGDRDGPREDFMSEVVAWALAKAHGEPVLLVCGGWHAPAIRRALAQRTCAVPSRFPPIPTQLDEGVVRGSYLVPFSYPRLDAFRGYEAGMPSPAFYEAAWFQGPEKAGEAVLHGLITSLRAKATCSTADLLSASTAARGLARLRGHAAMGRTDLLDGLSAALIKEALVVPAPWSQHAGLLAHTDPIQALLLEALRGDRRGQLAAGTPQPSLVRAAMDELEAEQLLPRQPQKIELSLLEPAGRQRSRLLHRLALLEIPGFESGSLWRTGKSTLRERWLVHHHENLEATLIEAAAWGATLESAAGARLEAALLAARGDLEALAHLIGEALMVGLDLLATDTLGRLAQSIGSEPSLIALGAAAATLLGLYRHGELLGAARAPALAQVLEAAADRGLFLLEGRHGEALPADPAELQAVATLRDLYRSDGLQLERARCVGTMVRVAADRAAPPALRGAALGAAWSLGGLGDAATAREHSIAAIRAAARPATCGDFLAGLFALARAEVLAESTLIAALDDVIGDFGDDELLIAIPALRHAFGYFPPLEKEKLAGHLLGLHGGDPLQTRSLLRLGADAEVVRAGIELERRVCAAAQRYGLLDALGSLENTDDATSAQSAAESLEAR